MKKLVSLVLVAVMMLCAVPAFATETTVVNWADLQEQGAETIARGEFVVFDEIAVKMWVPAGLNAVELTDEDKESGYIAYFMPEDESAALAVMYVDANGMTLEEYKALLPDAGATEIEDVIVNGMPAITYVLEENDTIIGIITAITVPGIGLETIFIDTVALSSAYQHKGYGTQMLNEFFKKTQGKFFQSVRYEVTLATSYTTKSAFLTQPIVLI